LRETNDFRVGTIRGTITPLGAFDALNARPFDAGIGYLAELDAETEATFQAPKESELRKPPTHGPGSFGVGPLRRIRAVQGVASTALIGASCGTSLGDERSGWSGARVTGREHVKRQPEAMAQACTSGSGNCPSGGARGRGGGGSARPWRASKRAMAFFSVATSSQRIGPEHRGQMVTSSRNT
jgi:hypothetical protein